MKSVRLFAALLLVCCSFSIAITADAQEKAFLGKWDIQGVAPNEGVVYWLEIKKAGDGLEGWFLNRGGSVYKLPSLKIENGELTFPVSANANAPVQHAKVEGGKLTGWVTVGSNTIKWVGVRPPKWGNYNANGNHKFGAPVALFDGKSLDAFDVQLKTRPFGWSVSDGIASNDVHGNNLVSKQKFQDFKIECEYKLEDKSNSGIYLRGRYELQVLDDYGKPVESHGHMAVYSRVAPKVNASKPKGEWQQMEAVIVGNRVTVRLNGQVVQDNTLIEGITGGALDANEGAPGPIMIQGDHEKVHFRKIVVTPIIK
ncbi:MAG: DUF1080 domain-containing protein [Blastocatellia bacterium]